MLDDSWQHFEAIMLRFAVLGVTIILWMAIITIGVLVYRYAL
jgi:hypothetical protein